MGYGLRRTHIIHQVKGHDYIRTVLWPFLCRGSFFAPHTGGAGVHQLKVFLLEEDSRITSSEDLRPGADTALSQNCHSGDLQSQITKTNSPSSCYHLYNTIVVVLLVREMILFIRIQNNLLHVLLTSGHDDISLVDAEKWMDMLMRQKFPELEPLALAAVMHAVRASYLYRNGYHQTPAAPHPMVPIKIMSEVSSILQCKMFS